METFDNLEEGKGYAKAAVAALLLLLVVSPIGVLAKAVGIIVAGFLVTGNRPYWLCVIALTLPRDLSIIICMIKVTYLLWNCDKKNITVAKKFAYLTEKHPEKVAFFTDERPWTYLQIWRLSKKLAVHLQSLGITRGEAVAVSGEGVRLAVVWLALAILGAPAALLPPRARKNALLHALKAANAKAVLFEASMKEAIDEIQGNPNVEDIAFYQCNVIADSTPTNQEKNIISVSLEPDDGNVPCIEEELAKGTFQDSLLYIYTSGTTGLPKAAIITNSRYLTIASVLNEVIHLGDKDVIYTPLPMHHTAGGVLGAGQALVFGVSVVLRNKFSAANFWTDCVKYNCTVAQYIGELCRFLLVSHDKAGAGAAATQHNIRLMVGNGLRSSIWRRFQDTFKIPAIYELYGATESNTNMMNTTSKEGAVGFIPRYISFISPILIVKCDESTGEIIRNEKGLCTKCGPCEPGLMLGKVDHEKRLYSYTGYVDKESNRIKMITDVMSKGDCFFNSGDILVMDHLGYFYFRDRTGDTFRWRGENVSTNEVEDILTTVAGLADIVVYGVEIPGVEGKAGMAAMVDPEKKLDLSSLVQSMANSLPPFAQPLFIRVIDSIPLTITNKMIKTDLRKDGFNIDVIKDDLYFLDSSSSKYVRLTKSLYEDIIGGIIRL